MDTALDADAAAYDLNTYEKALPKSLSKPKDSAMLARCVPPVPSPSMATEMARPIGEKTLLATLVSDMTAFQPRISKSLGRQASARSKAGTNKTGRTAARVIFLMRKIIPDNFLLDNGGI